MGQLICISASSYHPSWPSSWDTFVISTRLGLNRSDARAQFDLAVQHGQRAKEVFGYGSKTQLIHFLEAQKHHLNIEPNVLRGRLMLTVLMVLCFTLTSFWNRGTEASSDTAQHEQLDHLTGSRCLLSTWVVCGHFIARTSGALLFPASRRAFMAVDMFVMLSGFISHWACCTKDFTSFRVVREFYTKRLGRVLLTASVANMAAVVVKVAVRDFSTLDDPFRVLRCFLFVESWIDYDRGWDWQSCPNDPTWTIASLIPAWLLYPLMHRLVAALWRRCGCSGLSMAGACLWATSFGPSLAIFLRQGMIECSQYLTIYMWPPSMLANFFLGVLGAEIAQRLLATTHRWRWGSVADACAGLVVSSAIFAPYGQRCTHHSTWLGHGSDALLIHGIEPAIVLFFIASAVAGRSSMVVRILSHPGLSSLGVYSFEVYLFQVPMHDLWVRCFGSDQMGFAIMFLPFLVSLWLFSGVYAELVEKPMVRWIRIVASTTSTESGSSPESKSECDTQLLASGTDVGSNTDPR